MEDLQRRIHDCLVFMRGKNSHFNTFPLIFYFYRLKRSESDVAEYIAASIKNKKLKLTHVG